MTDQNNTAANEKGAINSQIDSINQQIQEYTDIENAVSGDTGVSSSNPYVDQYNSYKEQVNATPDQQAAIKSQFLAGLQSSIDQLQSEGQSLNIQGSGLENSNAYDNSLSSQLASLKAQEIEKANQTMVKLDSNIADLSAKIALQKQADAQSTDRASSAGVLHVLPNVSGLKTIPVGTPVAQIYPELSKNAKIELTAYVPSTTISSVKTGQTLRFTVQQNLPKPEILSGKISKIDSAPTSQKGLNLYEVKAKIVLKKSDLSKIRYGLQGKVTVVIGSKTYFDYYKDKVMGKD